MRILLVANYEPSNQKSMQRFAAMLDGGLRAAGHETRVIRPPVIAGRIPASGTAAKWLGYGDKFIAFPPMLRKAAEWADVVHICDQSNAFYVKHIQNRPHVVTCHDMLAIRSALGEISCHPTAWTGRRLQDMILRGLRQARHIACVSEATRLDLLRVAGIPQEHVSLIYNGLNFAYAPMDSKEAAGRLGKFGLQPDKPYILHVGGNDWYKNRPGVLKIFSILRNLPDGKELSIVMAGQPMTRQMREFVREQGLNGSVLELVDPVNEDLKALYSSARLLLFPSLEEGFGWPILEAQACGCPVVTSNRAPMTEVGGGAATYIDPLDPESAANTAAAVLRRATNPCSMSLQNAARFKTPEMTGSYIALYKNLKITG